MEGLGDQHFIRPVDLQLAQMFRQAYQFRGCVLAYRGQRRRWSQALTAAHDLIQQGLACLRVVFEG